MVDSHCHIDLYKDPLAIARSAEKSQIFTVAVTHLPSHYDAALKHLEKFEFVRPALGLHPLVPHQHKAELSLFKRFSNGAEFIGEIGLDFSSAGKASRIQQEESFDFVLSCLKAHSKFITLHSRGAESEILMRLRQYSICSAVFHYFSGTRSQLAAILDRGDFVSINTAMIRTQKWREYIQFVPLTRILTETDGPFVKVGRQAAVPANVEGVCKWLAIERGLSTEEVVAQINRNFRSIAAIPPPIAHKS